jgi:hypothetical protein
MSEFSLSASITRAEARLLGPSRPAARRSDAGKGRLAPVVEAELLRQLARGARPALSDALAAVRACFARLRLRAPSRATVYAAIERVEPLPLASYSKVLAVPVAVTA